MKELHWNILTILVLIATLLVVTAVSVLIVNPYRAWNPLQPPPLPEVMRIPTATATLKQLPPTWTFTPAAFEFTPTLLPSSTPLATSTGFVLPTATQTDTPTVTATITELASPTRTRTKVPTATEEPPPQPTDPPPPTDTPVPPTNTPEPPTPPPAPTQPG